MASPIHHIFVTNVGGTIFDRFGRRHTAAELLASETRQTYCFSHDTVQNIVFDTAGT